MLPVITAAAPPTALRIKKLRRSTPGGTAFEINSIVLPSGSLTLVLSDGPFELTVSSTVLFSFSDMVQSPHFHLDSDRHEPPQLRFSDFANLRFVGLFLNSVLLRFASSHWLNSVLPPYQLYSRTNSAIPVRITRYLDFTDFCPEVRLGVGMD